MPLLPTPGLAVQSEAAAPTWTGRRLLKGYWNGAGPTGVTRQAGDEGLCGVKVSGFESLASVPEGTGVVDRRPHAVRA
jgi:hypothetical protein